MRIVYLITVFVLSLLIVLPVSACSPVSPDYWFDINLAIDEDKVPKQMSITRDNDTYTNLKTLELRAKTRNPIYILKQEKSDQKIPDVDNEKYTAVFKFELNQIFRYSEEHREFIRIDGISRYSLGSYDFEELGIEIKNKQADNRPMEVDIPQKQSEKLLIQIQDQIYKVPVAVSYELNLDYDPTLYGDAVDACADFDESQSSDRYFQSLAMFGGLIVIIIGLVALVKYLKIETKVESVQK